MRTSPIAFALALALAALPPAALQAQQGGRWRFHRGMGAESWARMDAVAVVRVTGAPTIPENPNDTRRSWPVVLLATYAGGPPVSRVKLHGGKNGPDGWFEAPGVYLVVGAMPKDGKDAPLFDDQDTTRLDPAPDGQARVYWALPFRGSPPRAGGTKEEFFGRAVLAALEGDPQVYREGLEEFFQGVDRSVLGLTELGGNMRGNHGYGGFKANDFALGLRGWALRCGSRERLFAAAALWRLGVTGAMPFYARAAWEWSSLDEDPPTDPWYLWPQRGPGGFFTDVPDDIRGQMLGTAPTPEEWVGRLLALKNAKTVEFLLSAGCEGHLGEILRRRMVALLDSESQRVRWMVCSMFWAWTDYSTQEEMDERNPQEISEERQRAHGPPDYPRLDEHVAYWKAYYR